MYYVKRQGFPLKVTLHNTCTSPPIPQHTPQKILHLYIVTSSYNCLTGSLLLRINKKGNDGELLTPPLNIVNVNLQHYKPHIEHNIITYLCI